MRIDLKKMVGQRLQLLRLQKKLTQEQMGERLNLSTSAYCKIEYGETDLTLMRLYKIAEILNLPILELFSRITTYIDPNSLTSTSLVVGKEYSVTHTENSDNLRELIKANARVIDILCKRLDVLEERKSSS